METEEESFSWRDNSEVPEENYNGSLSCVCVCIKQACSKTLWYVTNALKLSKTF